MVEKLYYPDYDHKEDDEKVVQSLPWVCLGDKRGEIQLLNVPIMREFFNIFLYKLSGVPLEKEVEVIIDVLFGMSLITQSLYRMVPAELVELEI